MDVKGKKVIVIGSGKSGEAAAKLLLRNGAGVILNDSNTKLDAGQIRSEFKEDDDIKIILGNPDDSELKNTAMAVLSPGVPTDIELVGHLRELGIDIIGEIELAACFEKGDILAITGTNGKTTTTTLVGEIMKNFAKTTGSIDEVYVVGNIGEPYTDIADQTTERSVTVAEISSFQLETTRSFAPKVSAILNITPDHLNRHKTMAEYVRVKERIALKQGKDDTIVLNYDDALTRDFGKRAGCRVVYFTRNTDYAMENENEEFLHINNGMIMYKDTEVIRTDDMLLIGTHNYENVMAAVGMCLSYGVPLEVIRDTVRNFHAVEHRIEFVKTVDGVDYYNDSKGTNPDAAIKAVQAMKKPTLLIGGGYDKASAYDEWIESFDGKVKCLVLIGQTADKIAECARKHGFNEIVMAADLKEAVTICHDRAESGDAVLLSPACASWGMFKNYEERGHKFKEYVKGL